MIYSLLVFLSSMVISFFITLPIVWALTRSHIGQPVRKEGPQTHRVKAGTPTMGGIGFIAAISILSIILIDLDLNPNYFALLLLFIAYALIGLADDALKIFRGKNLGLTFWQKIILQTFSAAVFSAFIVLRGGYPFPVIYFLFSTFIIVGSANAANLTDGLNGLLGGTGTIAFLAFSLVASRNNYPEAQLFSLVCAGAVFAFLYFNFPKAKVFMGDVGSLSIGAILAGMAIIIKKELLLAVIGGIFVIEALSVILQVTSYKLFKRRIFKMAPLHHHFEMMGCGETQVVIGFWAAGIIFALCAILPAR